VPSRLSAPLGDTLPSESHAVVRVERDLPSGPTGTALQDAANRGPVRQASSGAEGTTTPRQFGTSYGPPALDDVLALLRAPWVDYPTSDALKRQGGVGMASWTDKSVTSSSHLDPEARVLANYPRLHRRCGSHTATAPS
jgi:hypothetical protein